MSKIKSVCKIVPILLIISILLTACEVPDISKFTEQSAEMTRGIRKGVKDTESVIKALSIREDLYSSAHLTIVKTELTEYQKAVKPTLKALDSLDAYLEALNALAQANKKSEVNAGAVVNSVTGLVDAVAGIKLAGSSVNIATGLLTLAEQFRTEKAFKERVNIASRIVEGEYIQKVDDGGQKVFDKNGKPVIVKACTDRTKSEVDAILTDGSPNKEARVKEKGCGVVDFIKFNIEELKEINSKTSDILYTGLRSKHDVIITTYKELNDNNENLGKEMASLVNFQNISSIVQEDYDDSLANPSAIGRRIRLLNTELRAMFVFDPKFAGEVTAEIRNCGNACQETDKLINTKIDTNTFGELVALDECGEAENVGKSYCQFIENVVKKIDKTQFANVSSLIAKKMEPRRKEISQRIDLNNADLQRITPAYTQSTSELKVIKDRQNQLDALLNTSTNALDAWTDSHANLRVAVNTKKPLTVSRLTAKVREIWEIIDKKPETEN